KSYLVEANKLLAQVVLLERLPGTSDDVQRFKKTSGDANNLAGDGRIGDARQLLEDVPEQINKSRSDAEHRQQLAVESENSKRKELQEQTKHKQLFEDKLTDAQQMLLTIQDLPGAEASWRDASNCLE